MSLAPGTRLGPYEIVSRLGAGGMGEVFRARDTRLERSVAIKILPPQYAADPQLRSRFEREAKAISQLNDPTICTLYDIGSDGGTHYLVMELVEGETLAARIARGPLPVEEVLRLGSQIAAALERAHAAGIIHRDLKPANVMITKSGAKLLDFGLARSAAPRATPHDAPTQFVDPITSAGMVVGTLPYMPPEQLQGEEADPRSDIFALGAVLYEMITGRRPFEARSSASLIAQILEHRPPGPAELKPGTPQALERVIMTCLEKERGSRFQCAGDVHRELRAAAAETADGTKAASQGRRRPIAVAVVLLSLAVAIASSVLAWRASRRPSATENVTFSQLTFERGEETHPALSPDGTTFVFVKSVGGQRDIFLQRVDGSSAINLTADSSADDTEPAFSPDGSRIAFRSERDGGGIFVMGATGESVRRLTESGFSPDWAPDGKSLLFASERMAVPHFSYGRSALHVVDVASGAVRLLFEGDARLPRWSPHGKRIAFFTPHKGGQRDILTIDSSGRRETIVAVTDDVPLDWNPVWSPDGTQLYFASDRDGTMNIWQVGIDEESGKTTGEPRPLRAPSGYSSFLSVDRSGRRLLFQATVRDGEVSLFRVDPEREAFDATPVPVLRGSLTIYHAAPSPDGRQIAFVGGPREDLFVVGADGSGLRQLTSDDARQRGPGWWPDGSRVTFYSNSSGQYQSCSIRPDGSGLTALTAGREGSNFPRISADQRSIAFISDAPDVKNESGRFARLAPGVPVTTSEVIPATPEGPFFPMSWSPDGRQIAGGAWGPNPSRLYLFTPGANPVRLTDDSVRGAQFLDDRRLLYLSADERLCIFNLQTRTSKVIGKLPPVPDARSVSLNIGEGGRFLTSYRVRTDSDVWLMTLSP